MNSWHRHSWIGVGFHAQETGLRPCSTGAHARARRTAESPAPWPWANGATHRGISSRICLLTSGFLACRECFYEEGPDSCLRCDVAVSADLSRCGGCPVLALRPDGRVPPTDRKDPSMKIVCHWWKWAHRREARHEAR